MTLSNIISIFIDGASRNNPGPAGAGVYIKQNNTVICKKGYFLEKKTNNQAEYLSLLIALLIVEKLNGILHIASDSELLVRQMHGLYRVKNREIAKIKNMIDRLLENRSYTIRHIIREDNKIADKLANEGIEKKNALPLEIEEVLKHATLL